MYKYIIDAHAHIFPVKIAEKASENIGKFYDLAMNYDGTLETLMKEGDECGVTKYIVQSVATTAEQVTHINDFIANTVAEHSDRLIGFASLNPLMESFDEEIDRVISLGLKGIKLHPDFQKFALDSGNAFRIFDAVGEKLPFLVHTGDKRYRYSNPALMAKAAKAFPHARFIAAHFGGWSEWGDAVEYLSKLDNIWIDTSSSLYELSPERAAKLVNRFGDDRVFFGTDYPMWSACDELAYIEKIPLSHETKEKIMWKNINDFLQLGLS